MRRILKIVGGILAGVVVLVVGAVVYILNVDLNAWKPEIQEAVQDSTGRLLVINGPIEFELGSDTLLKASDITLTNAEWGSRPQMVEVGSVDIELKLFSLLGDTPDITRVHVDNVRAIVETNAQGMSNTDFGTAAEEEEPKTSGGDADLVLPIIRDLRIADVEVVMKDGAQNTEQTFRLTELTLGSEAADAPLALNLDAAFDDLALIMTGQMGSLQSMTDAGQPTPVDFVGNLAGIDVSIIGQIQDLAGQQGIDVTISALGQELADAAKIAGIQVPSLGGFKVDATLKGSGDALSVDPLVVDIGKPDVIHTTVNGKIADAQGQEGIELAVAVKSTEVGRLSPITRAFAGQDVPDLGPLDVKLNVLGGLEDGLQVSGLNARLGKDDLILVNAAGDIQDVMRQKGIALNIDVTSPQIGNLTPVVQQVAGPDQSIPPLGPMSLKVAVNGGMDSGLAAEGLDLTLGGADTLLLSVTGGVGDLLKQDAIDLNIAAKSPELGNLSDIAKSYSGQGIPDIGPMNMTAKVSGGMESGLGLNDLAVDFGRPETIKVQANGGIANLMAQTGVDLTVKAVSPEVGNLSPLVEAFSDAAVPALGPLDMSLRVAGDANGTMSLSELALALGKAETLLVEANGTVADLVKMSGADLGFKVVSPDLSVLSDVAGTDVPAIGPVDISGQLKGDAGEPMSLEPFAAKIGDSDISGTVTFDGTGDVPSIVARLNSDRFDLKDVSPPSEGGQTSSGGGAASGGAAQPDDGKVIPADPLPFEMLSSINADIQYKAGTLIAVSQLTDLDVAISLQNGSLTVSPFKAGVGTGSISGTIALDGSQAEAPLAIVLNGDKMGLDALLAGSGMAEKVEGPLDLTIDLKGAGNNPRAIAASLDGKFQMSVYDSRVLKKAFEDAFGDLIANMLASEGGWILLDCAVFDYDLTKGLAETKAGYTASGPVTVTTRGQINLGTEQLDLAVKPRGAGLATLPLQVSGSFTNPSVIPDPTTVGIGILTGVLTGGIAPALLAVVGDLPEDHPCRKEVAESQEQLENQPEESGAATNPVENPAKAIEEGIGGAVKNLFGN
ncbi:AsmA family protein [Pacificispira sp.]|uniref:AsmA family protein n=1 Tax=Pacificispira sp. TaxID=2888761 RepID=UPI003BAA62F7